MVTLFERNAIKKLVERRLSVLFFDEYALRYHPYANRAPGAYARLLHNRFG
jgi:hypothetical protein